MAKVLGYWRCDYCQSGDKIPGNVRNCPNCGRPVGENVKYEIDSSFKRVVASKREVPSGPDWKCNYCSSYNRFEETICKNCGALKENESLNYFENLSKEDKIDYEDEVIDINEKVEPFETFSESFKAEILDEESSDRNYYSYTGSSKNIFSNIISKHNLKIFGIIFSVILAIVGITLLVIPKEKEIMVESFSWERVMYIEKYTTCYESDWNLPAGARLRDTEDEITYYTDVFVGYEEERYTVTELDHIESRIVDYKDLGNGYFDEITETEEIYRDVEMTTMVKKYEPQAVYDTMYYYDTDKFSYNRSVVTKASDKNPYWGEEPPKYDIPKIGDERVSSRKEKYMIYGTILDEKQETKQYTLDFSSWDSLNEGDVIRCKVYITGKIKIIEE